MKKAIQNFLTLSAAASLALISIARADETPVQPEPKPARSDLTILEKDTTAGTLGNIFVKGSVDGEKLFMVVGVEDGYKMAKASLKESVSSGELIDFGATFYNKYHHDDYASEVAQGYDYSVGQAPKILSAPWKSLKQIPGAFQVDLKRGSTAYEKSANKINGSIKYGAWAVWAVIDGATRLVIEAPVQFLWYTSTTALGIPLEVVGQTIEVAFKGSWIALRFAFCLADAAVSGAWSVISSTSATALAVVGGGGVAVYKGAVWAVHRATGTGPVTEVSDLRLSSDEQPQALADRLVAGFQNDGLVTGKMLIQNSSKSPKITVQFAPGSEAGKLIKELTIKIKALKEPTSEFNYRLLVKATGAKGVKKDQRDAISKLALEIVNRATDTTRQ